MVSFKFTLSQGDLICVFQTKITSVTVSEQWSIQKINLLVMQEFEAEIFVTTLLVLAFSRVCFGRVKDCF